MRNEETADIDLTDLIERERIRTALSLTESIQALQEKAIERMEALGYRRHSAYRRFLVTSLGGVQLEIVKMKKGRRVISPILDVLGIRRRKYSPELRMICADKASRQSYGDTKKDLERDLHISIPKITLHSFLQEVGGGVKEDHERLQQLQPTTGATTTTSLPVVMGDGTQTHSIYETNNQVRVVMTRSEDGQKRLLGIAVNAGWDTIPGLSGPRALVSDCERDLVGALADEKTHVQPDLVHMIRDTLFKLWGEGMPKDQRDTVSKEMSRILFTLVNSVRKHEKDGDSSAIGRRIESTLEGLERLSKYLRRRGFTRASEFVSRTSKLAVTFAKLAIDGIRIPYTSNAMERLMGTIAARCKHRWMHWSTRGLENLLWILLVQYTDQKEYLEFWTRFVHPSIRQ